MLVKPFTSLSLNDYSISINYEVSVNLNTYCNKLTYNYVTHVVKSCLVLIVWSIIIWYKYNYLYNHSIDASKLSTVLLLVISPQPKTPVMRWGTEKSHFKYIQVYNFFYTCTLRVVKFCTVLIMWSVTIRKNCWYKLLYNYAIHVEKFNTVLIVWSIILWYRYDYLYNHTREASRFGTMLTLLSRTL